MQYSELPTLFLKQISMKNRFIVQRRYSVLNGKKSKRVEYAVAPKDASGMECFHTDIEKAYLFKKDYLQYSNLEVGGSDRYGDYIYKQELIKVKLVITNKNK